MASLSSSFLKKKKLLEIISHPLKKEEWFEEQRTRERGMPRFISPWKSFKEEEIGCILVNGTLNKREEFFNDVL